MSRRENGAGSITGTYGHYRGHITVDGKRIDRRGKTKTIVSSKLQLAASAPTIDAAVKRPTPRPTHSRKTTVGEFLDLWLAEMPLRVLAGNMKPRTLDVYSRNVRLHLKPALGGVLLNELTREHVMDLQATLFAKTSGKGGGGLGNATVAQVHRTLHTALQHAVNTDRLAVNVAGKVPKPSLAKIQRPDALTQDEGAALLYEADPTSLQRGPARVAASCHLGMRQGEVLGLWLTDLDPDCTRVSVRQTLCRPAWTHGLECKCDPQDDQQTAGVCPARVRGPIADLPKSVAGVRTIPIPPTLQPIFREHVRLLLEQRELLADVWLDRTPWLFPGLMGKTPDLYLDGLRWRRLVAKICGPSAPGGTHAGRRHAATRLAEQGVPIHTAMELLGWNQAELQAIYARIGGGHKASEMARAWAHVGLD